MLARGGKIGARKKNVGDNLLAPNIILLISLRARLLELKMQSSFRPGP
jgi:hypothetical protein